MTADDLRCVALLVERSNATTITDATVRLIRSVQSFFLSQDAWLERLANELLGVPGPSERQGGYRSIEEAESVLRMLVAP